MDYTPTAPQASPRFYVTREGYADLSLDRAMVFAGLVRHRNRLRAEFRARSVTLPDALPPAHVIHAMREGDA